MTCQECEIKLGMGEDAGEHLALCEECRWLARELRLNSVALQEMRAAGPGGPARTRASAPLFVAALAVAAVVVVAIGVWRTPPVEKPPERAAAAKIGGPTKPADVAVVKRVRRKTRMPVEPLRVKMLTSDPDVVIYWIVDKKEGFE